jgi:hypothetical protein
MAPISKRARFNPFIDDEAEVRDSPDEEEEEEDDGLGASHLPTVLTKTN